MKEIIPKNRQNQLTTVSEPLELDVLRMKIRMGLTTELFSQCYDLIMERHVDFPFSIHPHQEAALLEIMQDELVVHHCHYSGEVYGVTHKRCNSKVRQLRSR